MSKTLEATILSLVAETHIHVGTGQSAGALDLPVARERATSYPFVPGSGVKGALRVWSGEKAQFGQSAIDRLFGPKGAGGADAGDDLQAGNLLVSDARLLLLPVRSLTDAFKWVTCPALLDRFWRDMRRAGLEGLPALPSISVESGTYLGAATRDATIGLEEREFSHGGDIPADTLDFLKTHVLQAAAGFVDRRLILLSDDNFTFFARYALPVMTRNVLGDDKISSNLWHEESLAPDTVLYLLLGERRADAVSLLRAAIGKQPYIQMGGNETIGQGWFRAAFVTGPAGGSNA
ncbi:type III-B CRISPR module RAMP protein Cmr4 [Rhizobium sp. SG2393]|uniref:type III-B CRISPR module RAMP protein Cmr4 n=1 Tax=Rhizobium sp. SG2393 TaxID=3276279 RepID=UPI003670E558